ncbi:MAG: sigma factor-like helix-turn-helix DNA-binding protein, partial [Myxococcota bacterium]
PWLIRVAMNKARDLLRARRRRDYPGIWLPEPAQLTDPTPTGFGRYALLESATLAFLTAVEALTPQQRAVLLLRDVLDYTTAETAHILDLSTVNVKTTLHRARKRMEHYDHRRCPLSDDLSSKTQTALRNFMMAMTTGDTDTAASMLADDVRYAGDSGGHYWNATRILEGRTKVLAFLGGIARKYPSTPKRIEEMVCNGLPAVWVEVEPYHPRIAPQFVAQIALNPQDRLSHLFIVSAPDKLVRLSRELRLHHDPRSSAG